LRDDASAPTKGRRELPGAETAAEKKSERVGEPPGTEKPVTKNKENGK